MAARGHGSGDAWGVSVRDQLGGIPEATRLDLLSREGRRWNQTYWKAKIGYNMRWVAEGSFSIFKRVFGEHVMPPKWENIIQEIQLKVALYNRWKDESIARELDGSVPHMRWAPCDHTAKARPTCGHDQDTELCCLISL